MVEARVEGECVGDSNYSTMVSFMWIRMKEVCPDLVASNTVGEGDPVHGCGPQ